MKIFLSALALFLLLNCPAPAPGQSDIPNPELWTPDGTVHAVAVSDDSVYLGGDFTGVSGPDGFGFALANLALIGRDSNFAIPSWDPDPNQAVRALAVSPDGSTIYAGGSFTSIGGQSRNRLAAINAATGKIRDWDPGADSYVWALALSPDGNTVYVGGHFTVVGGEERIGLAAVNAVTGELTDWRSDLAAGGGWAPNAYALAVSPDGTRIYAGGRFDTVGGQERSNLVQIASDGDVTEWNPGIGGDNTVYSLALDPAGETIYAGGNFHTVGGQDRPKIAAIDADTGEVTAWNPEAGGILTTVFALAVSPDGSTVYAGGSFTEIGGEERSGLAALDADTGTPTAWNPALEGGEARTLTLTPCGSTVYVGGAFTSIGGDERRGHLARFDYPYRRPWIHDYSGDGTSDPAVFRPSTGLWAARGVTRAYFGTDGDIPVPGDYRGDGTTDIAVFRPSTGLWAVRELTRTYFGRAGDHPVPGDYRGDGTDLIGIFREESGLWAVRGVTRAYFGRPDDRPVPGYYGWDGTERIAVFRPSAGRWEVRGGDLIFLGGEGDLPVPGGYAGGQRWNYAVFRPPTGLWAIRNQLRAYFGREGDIPVPGDYRGGFGDEITIFRPETGLWAVRGFTRFFFGASGDIPVSR